jgi:hypothetical protein
MLNTTASDASVELVFRTSGGTFSATLTVPSDAQVVLDDVVGFVGATGSGSLEVRADQALVVGSRTYNLSPDGTFGQYLDGQSSTGGLDAGQEAVLPLLEETAAFRTNIGYTNIGSTPATVIVRLFDAAGDQVGQYSVTVPAGGNVQTNRPFSTVAGRTDIVGGYATVEVSAGSGVIVYGSVIDNLTGDPTTIPATS